MSKKRSRVAAALLAVLLSGCSGQSTEELMSSAQKHFGQGEYRPAILQLMNVLQQEPNSVPARHLLGQVLLESGDAAGAAVELQRALDGGLSQDKGVPMLARAVLRSAGPDRTLQKFGDIKLSEAAAMADLRVTIAQAQILKKQLGEARANIDAAVKAAPDFVPGRLLQARMLASAGNMSGAHAILDELFKGKGDVAAAWQLRGDLQRTEGKVDDALAAYRKAIALDPKDVSSRSAVLEVLFAKRDLQAAAEQIEQLKKVAPGHVRTTLFVALMALENNNLALAREGSQKLLKASPDNPRYLQLAGAIETKAGSLAQAESALGKALHLDPSQNGIRLMLAQVSLLKGEGARSIQTLEPLLSGNAVSVDALRMAGRAALTTGDAKAAEAYFDKAVKLSPDDVASRVSLSVSRLSRGNIMDRELAELDGLAAQDPGPTADFALIAAQLRARNLDKALAATQRLEKKPGMASIALHLAGRVHLERRDVPAARAAFEASLSRQPAYYPAASALAALDLQEGKPEQARKRMEALLEVAPNNVEARMALFSIRSRLGANQDELLGMLQTAIKLTPTAVQPRVALINLELKRKQLKAAVAAAQEAVASIPNDVELLDLAGQAQLAAGDFGQAQAAFSKLAGLQPQSVAPLLRLAQVDMTAKRSEQAIANVKKAMLLDPNNPEVIKMLAIVQLAAGRSQEALRAAKPLQANANSAAMGWMVEGDVHVAVKNWKAAADAYRRSLERAQSTETAIKLHTALTMAKEDAAAVQNAWLKSHPGDSGFLRYLAAAELDAERYEDSERHYKRVVEINPKDAVAWNNLAWLAGRRKDPAALEYIRSARALFPKDPAFVDTQAEIYAMAGDLERAVHSQEEAVALAPNRLAMRWRLANLYVAAGKKEAAKRELTSLAGMGDKFAKAAEAKALLNKL